MVFISAGLGDTFDVELVLTVSWRADIPRIIKPMKKTNHHPARKDLGLIKQLITPRVGTLITRLILVDT